MDNFTHSLFGIALSKAGAGGRSRLAPWVACFAANVPDADVLVGVFGGKESYLDHHRGITHSVIGVAAQAVMIAFGAAKLERCFSEKCGEALGFARWLGLAAAALLSHLLLDGLVTYGIQPWLPFSDAHVYGDMTFIVDPWQWLIYGGVVALAGERSRAGSALLLLCAAGAAAACKAYGAAPELIAVWCGGAAAVAVARALGVGRRYAPWVAAAGAVALVLYLSTAQSFGARAMARALTDERREFGNDIGLIVRSSRSPEPLDFYQWRVVLETEKKIMIRKIRISGTSESTARYDKLLDDPRVVRAAATETGAVWRRFARHPMATIETNADGSTAVQLLDARYLDAGRSAWSRLDVVLK